jgi:hypothetical protein
MEKLAYAYGVQRAVEVLGLNKTAQTPGGSMGRAQQQGHIVPSFQSPTMGATNALTKTKFEPHHQWGGLPGHLKYPSSVDAPGTGVAAHGQGTGDLGPNRAFGGTATRTGPTQISSLVSQDVRGESAFH